MQAPFDLFAKAIIDGTLDGLCDVSLQEPVSPEAMLADAVVDPRATAEQLRTRGLLGRMACEPCVIEPFSSVPSVRDADRCVARAALLRVARGDELWRAVDRLAGRAANGD